MIKMSHKVLDIRIVNVQFME